MSQQDNLTPPPFNGDNITEHCFFHLFKQFSVVELAPLRLVSHAWNDAVMHKFAELHQMTIQLTCTHGRDPIGDRPLCTSSEMFHLADIVEGNQEIARQNNDDIVESVGEVISVSQVAFPSLVQTVQQFISLHELIVYWSQCHRCLEQDQVPALAELIEASIELTRFSFWYNQRPTDDQCHFALSDRLCVALGQTGVTRLHINLPKVSDHFSESSAFATLLPRLRQLTIGYHPLHRVGTLTQQLPILCRSLNQLKLNGWKFANIGECRQFVQQLANLPLTSLALSGFTVEQIAIVCQHLTALTQLKLANTAIFDNQFAQPLQRLTQVTDLSLINYHLQPTQPIYYALPSVTNLTLTNDRILFSQFYTELNPGNRNVYRLNVTTVSRVLFEQFPSLRELTLVGPVCHPEQVRRRLRAELPAQVEILNMFFVGHRPILRHRTRQMARKRIGVAPNYPIR